jgi:hypothetical protein
MPGRHSRVSCVHCLAPLAVLVVGACAQSGADNEHGPAFDDSGADATQRDTGSPDEGGAEAGAGDAAPDGLDAGTDTAVSDSATGRDTSSDAPAESAAEAGGGDSGFVAPTCDGVIGPGEYGGVADEQTSSSGQIWYVTWDATHLYVAISSATVTEANVLYIAVPPGDGGTGLTSGYAYDKTDVTSLPFAASLVVYAKPSPLYSEARAAGAGAWGAPNTTAVQVCATGAASTVREEVIPWSLVGGLPGSFGWTGYLAANPTTNLTGFIYGQMPIDTNAGGPDAGGESFTRYYAVPNATPGMDTPFADEQ